MTLESLKYKQNVRHARPNRAETKLKINVILRTYSPIYSAQSVNSFIVDKMTLDKYEMNRIHAQICFR